MQRLLRDRMALDPRPLTGDGLRTLLSVVEAVTHEKQAR